MEIYDEALRRWPVPFETSFVATRYGKTHVIASGDPASPPLVLLHPMGVGASFGCRAQDQIGCPMIASRSP
jgi:hypothetical protein